MEWRLHALERRGVALELIQLRGAPLEAPLHEMRNEVFLQPHVVRRIVPGDLWLDHPEFGQVPTRLRLLCAEGRAEGVDLPERSRRGLTVELSGLREIRVPFLEV